MEEHADTNIYAQKRVEIEVRDEDGVNIGVPEDQIPLKPYGLLLYDEKQAERGKINFLRPHVHVAFSSVRKASQGAGECWDEELLSELK